MASYTSARNRLNNATVTGTLTVTGDATLSANLAVAGQTDIEGDFLAESPGFVRTYKIGNTATDTVGFHGKTAVAQQADITDASVAHALNVVFSDTEVEAALNALGAKINTILDVLDAYGFTA